jgi:nucleotide-binding universal stress UspA family protein
VFSNILVPVDLTDKNRRAVDVARALATRFDARITLLHVIETIDLPFDELEEFYERLERKAATGMEEFAAPILAAGVPVERCVAYGSRSREIVRHTDEHGVDLVVMSSRLVDPGNPSQDWATVSHKIAILARCPVLLVK